MNMAKLRQILEIRRATKMPPLLPPKKSKRANDELVGKRSQQKEILDIHLQLRNIECDLQQSAAGSIVCAFSESEETQRGPWRMTTASELVGRENFVDLPNVVAVEFQLERVQFLRLDICDLFGPRQQKEAANSMGYCVFSVSELVCARGGRIQRKVKNDENGTEIAEALISCTLRPKPHAVLLQFAASNLTKKGIGNAGTAQVFFEIHRMPSDDFESGSLTTESNPTNTTVNNNHTNATTNCTFSNGTAILMSTDSEEGTSSPKGSMLYRSEAVKWGAGRILWRTFTLQSTDIARRELRFLCFQRSETTSSTKSSSPIAASLPPLPLGEFAMHFSVLRRGPGPENVYFMVYEDSRHRKKAAGTFELCRLHEICTPSFLEYIAAGSALNLAFAIDFSRPETSVDETTIRHYMDDVELSIGAFGEPLRDFNNANSFAAFGFGAKIPPHFRESQEFCLNLDTDPYCRGLSSVYSAFKTSFASVQPLNMAHLSHVIYYVAKLAQNSMCRPSPAFGGGIDSDYNPPAYFALVIITRGIFDDLKETVQAIIFASRAPLSIIFVGIGDDDQELGELERLATAGTRLNFHGRKPERDCTQYVSVPGCRLDEAKLSDLKALIAERGLATLSTQMCSWMMRNGYQKAPPSLLDFEPTTPTTLIAANCNKSPRRHPLQTPPPQSPSPLISNLNLLTGARSSTGSLTIGIGTNNGGDGVNPAHPLQNSITAGTVAGKISNKVGGGTKAGRRPLEGRGGSHPSMLMMMASPTASTSSSSGHASMIGGATISSPAGSIISTGYATSTNSTISSSTLGSASSVSGRKSPAIMPTSVQQRFRNLELNDLSMSSLPGTPRRRLPSTNSVQQQNCSTKIQQYRKTDSGGALVASSKAQLNRQQHFSEGRSFSTQQSSNGEQKLSRLKK